MSKTKVSKTLSNYPFSAIVGQEEMKLALVLNVIEPSVGGALIMGHRGTAKSTVVRALADLLPEISVAGCAYRCDPGNDQYACEDCRQRDSQKPKRKVAVSVVELPLGATEDRVCGTIDIERALQTGSKRFEPGLLARANRGFLYVDEVNLLEDHLVDLLLDVAATGVNKVEREGMSLEHPARFVLIGSGNPEEGELRPQLLDRFGLCVEVKTEDELERRVDIVLRREAFERDRDSFHAHFAAEQTKLRRKITRATRSAANVKVERRILENIARLCSELQVDGHRGELTITRAARALAAFEGRRQVNETDVKRVAGMSLRHRLRRDALENTGSVEKIEQAIKKVFGDSQRVARRGTGGDGPPSDGEKPRTRSKSAGGERNYTGNGSPNSGLGADALPEAAQPALENGLSDFRLSGPPHNTRRGTGSQVRNSRQTGLKMSIYDAERGRYSRATSGKTMAVALDATLRAVAYLGSAQKRDAGFPSHALRYKLFKRKQGRLFVFAIDLSGSMAPNRIAQAKSLIIGLLRQSYIRRDSVAIVGFRGTGAELLLPPSRSILRARRVLDSVGVGGGTPLSAGLACCLQLAKRDGGNGADISLLLFTDGQANLPLCNSEKGDRLHRQQLIETEVKQIGKALTKAGVTSIVFDTQNPFRSSDAPQRIAQLLNARLVPFTHSPLSAFRGQSSDL